MSADKMDTELQVENKVVVALIDLPELCLDKILTYLAADLMNLINVAATNSQILKSSAERVFTVKYGSHMYYPMHLVTHNLAVLTIKHFGACITEVEFTVYHDSEKIHEFLNEMSQKCAFLAKLTVYWLENWSGFERNKEIDLKLKVPIKSVCELQYYQRRQMHKSWADINRWFPNVKSFTFNGQVDIPFEASLVAYLPKLEYFSLVYYGSSKSFRNVSDFVNANPQITKLYIHISEYYENELNIKWEATQITELSLSGELKGEFKDFMQLKNLQMLELGWIEKLGDGIICGLQELRIFSKIDNTVKDFLLRHQNLKKLKIFKFEIDFLRLLKKLPHLTEFRTECNHVDFYAYPVVDVANMLIEFMHQCKDLQLIELEEYAKSENDPLYLEVERLAIKQFGSSHWNIQLVKSTLGYTRKPFTLTISKITADS